jgi:hypothetical protein
VIFSLSIFNGLGEYKNALVEYGDARTDDQSLGEPIDRHKGDKHAGENTMSSQLSLTCSSRLTRRLAEAMLCRVYRPAITVTSILRSQVDYCSCLLDGGLDFMFSFIQIL